MIGLEIETSTGRRFKVGVIDGVVSAFVNVFTLKESPVYNPAIPQTAPVQLSISGFGADRQRLHWGDVTMALPIGESVSVRVVELSKIDEPTVTPMLPDIADDESDGDGEQ